jgi:hypothetical protein
MKFFLVLALLQGGQRHPILPGDEFLGRKIFHSGMFDRHNPQNTGQIVVSSFHVARAYETKQIETAFSLPNRCFRLNANC